MIKVIPSSRFPKPQSGAGPVVELLFPVADGTVKLTGIDQVCRKSTSIQDHPARGEEHHDVLQADDVEARNDIWCVSNKHMHRHHVEPRVKLYVRKEGSFPAAIKYTDVVRRTNTTLHVWLESRVDDYWNVDGGRELSGGGPVSPSSQC